MGDAAANRAADLYGEDSLKTRAVLTAEPLGDLLASRIVATSISSY